MDDLLAEFVAETREMLAAIEGELVAWEADPGDRARLDAIFRFVHTVKGNCGFFDFPRLEKLSHAAESALAEVRAGQRQPGTYLVNAVLAVIDRITELVQAIEAGKELPATSDERLIAALEPDGEDDCLEVDAPAGHGSDRRAASSPATSRSIRLPVELLDRLMSGISDMVLARNDLARRLRELGHEAGIESSFDRLSTIISDVRDGVSRIRMQRIDHLYSALPRLVRDLSAELGKQVMIDLRDGDVALDREMIELIRDPLTHIIRNAIDHGIERPGDRLAAGKPEVGQLSLSARQAGNRILLAVRDDGRGLDVDRISVKAVAQGIVTRAEIDALSLDRRLALIFEPGLSTAEQVSEISGRGVGMDVVRANLEKVGGLIRVESEPGEGTLFVLELPLTLSIVAALTVACGIHSFAIPQSYIEEIVRGNSPAIGLHELGDSRFVQFRDKRIPAISLDQVLGRGERLGSDCGSFRNKVFIIIRLAKGELFALVVDRVLDNEELVVKPLAPAVMAIGLYAGSTLLDDGNPILMLDIPNIAARHKLISSLATRRVPSSEKAGVTVDEGETVILFTDLAGQRRAMRIAAVNRIQSIDVDAIAYEGGQYRASVDSMILPIAGVDGPLPDTGRVTVLRLSDGAREILYAAQAVDDSATLGSALVPLPDSELLEGTALIEGVITAVVDAHVLFARLADGAPVSRSRTCRLPDGDAWARGFLAPLLSAAGYRVLADGEAEPVDVTIVCKVDADTVLPGTGAIVHIRADREPAHPGDTSIYRYDRAAILAALGRAAGG